MQASVFVGNIPYDATEEKLKDIFSAVGPVLNFRIVFDRETGKPKGYGFCQYKDQETANSAIRNLNAHEIGGRKLRVDSATNGPEPGGNVIDEPNRQQQQQQQQQHQQQQQSQTQQQQQQQQQQQILQQAAPTIVDPVSVINNLLSTTPPEQLFDICKQLKTSLSINYNETRQLLVTNPQLAYCILQILAMINAIDGQTAINTMHTPMMPPAPLQQMMPMITPLGPATIPGPATAPMLQHPNPVSVINQMPMPSVTLTPFAYTPAPGPSMAAPADPRLARQQQQQQQLPKQQTIKLEKLYE